MSFLDVGNGTGWMIDDENEISEQAEKEKAVSLMTEKVLKTLKEITSIYAEFGNQAMFDAFQNAVNEAMQKGQYENYFNDKNYEENSGQ